jgi:hypothetical protein
MLRGMLLEVVAGCAIVCWGLAWTFDLRGWGSRRVAAAANTGCGRGFAEHRVATRIVFGLALVAIGLEWLLAATS